MSIPTGYLDLTLREVLLLAGRAPDDGDSHVETSEIAASVERLERQIAERKAAADRSDDEWIREQIAQLTEDV